MKTLIKTHSTLLIVLATAVILAGGLAAYTDASEDGRRIAMAWIAVYIGGITAAFTWGLEQMVPNPSHSFLLLVVVCTVEALLLGALVGLHGAALAVAGGAALGLVLRIGKAVKVPS
ncbi:MAG: hypothetical protein JST44_21880 [Cyanobacteria bacterium SZAS LIN-5]|nr:hypothetical protein [Cyanobacteria bacterium SZAS LIN-5]